MSLVGNLGDLNLGDILQIVSLSRKSGMLRLRSGAERGCIVLLAGQVRGAAIEGEPSGLGELLVEGGFLSEAERKRAVESVAASGADWLGHLAQQTGLDPERLQGMHREQVASAVIGMLGWRAGEFRFEVREDGEGFEPEMLLATGINAQYLAIEATRLGDEALDDPALDDEDLRDEEPVGHAEAPAQEPVFSGERGSESASARRGPTQESPERPRPPITSSPPGPISRVPLILVDRDLNALDWLKTTLDDCFLRIHAFQDTDTGIARVRQYLARLVQPAVLLGVDEGNTREIQGLVRRLQRLAPDMPVLLFGEARSGARLRAGVAAAVPRPQISDLAQRQRWSRLEEAGDELRRNLEPWARSTSPEAAAPAPDRVERLSELSRQLQDPERRGEVLGMVLRFAAESFSRVVIFKLRDGRALGLSQRGLEKAGGPDADAVARLRFSADEPACFRAVIQGRVPYRGGVEDPGDRRLVERLGNAVPGEIYVAPLESGGEVAALLYADNLPESQPIGETGCIEVALREAGQALDRALLQRARGGADGAPPAASGPGA